MAFRLYNTLTSREEEFAPLEGNLVRMYTCGPTVYDYAHIGNYRTFVFQDILRRYLKVKGYQLHHVMNITDVDDKTIRNATAAGVSLREYTERFIQAFFEDIEKLRLEKPERTARATDHVPDMVALIQELEAKGFTYRSDGSIYFRLSNFPDYGKLSNLNVAGILPGARVDVEEYEKEHPRDFALWKAAREGEPSWDTALGRGRPGWHIECSAMSMKYLGESFDIHTGGTDLIFPHHENEIAQSEAATGRPFVRFWLHCEHLIVEGRKMSKSLGNYFTLRDLLDKGHSPEAIRYQLASVPYRRHLNFTFDGLRQAAASIERLRNFRLRLGTETFPPGEPEQPADLLRRASAEFEAALDDNLNTAAALGAVFEAVRELNTAADAGTLGAGNVAAAVGLLDHFDHIFAVLEPQAVLEPPKSTIDWLVPLSQPLHGPPNMRAAFDSSGETIGPLPIPNGTETGQQQREAQKLARLRPEEVQEKLQQRAEARQARDFALADRIRQELLAQGVVVEDTKQGPRLKRK